MAEQIPFDLPHAAAMEREDFMVTQSNRAAMALVDQWPGWPSYGAMLCGPDGSGKSHLAAIWQGMAGARSVSAAVLDRANVPSALATGAAVIEDIDVTQRDEAALFHLLNLARQGKHSVLLTSRLPPADLQVSLADLRSRLMALPFVKIAPPDDALLRAVLVKQFADRQIAVDDGLITYLLARMPRSLGVARELVVRIDVAALAEKAEITKVFAGRVLAEMSNPSMI